MATALTSLPPSVEQRLSGWARIQEKRFARVPSQARPTITLSRQFGCEGFPVAMRLKALLEAASGEPWTVFDRTLIDRVAADEGISRQVLADFGAATRGLEAFGFHPRGAVTSDEAFAKTALLITRVATLGNAIVVGRGGAVLCRGLANAFHFRLVADFDWRVQCLARRTGLASEEAAQVVKAEGRRRAAFIKAALGADVEDPLHYDAIFNNGRHTAEEIAAAVVAYVQTGWRLREDRAEALAGGVFTRP
jgi:cytidylate kinase